MKKFLIALLKGLRVLLSVALISAMSFGIYYYLDKAFETKGESTLSNFPNFPKNSLDVLVVGSSHGQYSFDPSIFYEETGLYSYSLTSACQPFEVSYYFIKEALKTQDIKLVILEGYRATPESEKCSDDSCYVLPITALTGEEKYKVIDFLPEEKANDYYFPLKNNHNDWKIKEDIEFLKPENVLKKDVLNKNTGYIYRDDIDEYPSNYWHANLYDHDIEAEMKPEVIDYLNKIYDLCQENNIQLFLYKTQIDGVDEYNQSVRHLLWKWADERNISYYDFIDNLWDDNFYINIHTDSFHPYITGAAIVTNRIANTIKGLNIDFNHQSYKELDELYDYNARIYLTQMVRLEHDPKQYFRILSDGYKGTIYLRYLGHGEDPCNQIYDAFRKMGLTDFDRNHDCFAILSDGQVIASSNTEINENFNGKNVRINKDGIYIDDQEYPGNTHYLTFLFDSEEYAWNEDVKTYKEINVFTGMDLGFEDYDAKKRAD